ncbi:putative bifunctional diguanylate cyclase/phosphodiesterase [Novosphingobium naphthalenivorans]|uniref:putative bifunctional diguanylate cyclase/phosphodiesterase n=1 Tax=Novosphingobium naphthalenivorans TaxID=273168 RepID=UPI001FE055B0|nr:EAL domain-containing protein [Novosphingobium naphthalenivorans]
MNKLPIGVGLFETDGTPVFMNRTFIALHNVDEEHSGEFNFEGLIAAGLLDTWKQDPRAHFEKVARAIRNGHSYSSEVDVGGRIIAIHDMPVEGGFLLSTQQDVTERVTAERRIAHLASHDPLTELANRSAFNTKLANAIEEAHAKRQKFGLLFVDLDRFKDVNDIFGHKAGDLLLQEMAKRFRHSAGRNFLARLGGDEFALIVSEGIQPEASGALSNQLIECTSEDFLFEGNSLSVGLSVGIAVYPDDGTDAKTLMSSADTALYRAKDDGRGVMRLFEHDMDTRIRQQHQLKRDIRKALERNEFSLYFQPQATVASQIYGLEVLLRWNHPTRGMLMPDDFVPVAEESGLIIELGEWVLRSACREAASWENPLQVSINLSTVQFRHGDLAKLVHEILLETGLSPKRLELEITETVLFNDFARAISQLRRLKALGVRIAMDDFGTGYSSLSYLQSFPFDTLKIDKSFVSGLRENNRSAEIIRAMIGLGRGLNLPIVAEGVETAEQLRFLSEEKCERIQGFLIGTPQPIEAFGSLLNPGTSQPAAAGSAG